jgi:hypothetical protein
MSERKADSFFSRRSGRKRTLHVEIPMHIRCQTTVCQKEVRQTKVCQTSVIAMGRVDMRSIGHVRDHFSFPERENGWFADNCVLWG